MPWKMVTVMAEKERFIELARQGHKISQLCKEFQISRFTGYKLLKRFEKEGRLGLEEKSRRPKTSPKQTGTELEQLILAIRTSHPKWGGAKISNYLKNRGHESMVSEKTVDRILKKYGCIHPEESRKRQPFIRFEHEKPNDLWQMDFKGHFAIGEQRCHPLTVLDDHSRFSLLIKACANEQGNTVKDALTEVFLRHGLPARMTMDNGTPWGYSGDQRYTEFSAWLIRLGIVVSHSRPRHPQTQGKIERFHRTLNTELLSMYSFEDLAHAQSGFDWWRRIYNEERPHEAIGYKTPAMRYQSSLREYPVKLPSIEYDSDLLVRKVQYHGEINFKGKLYRVGRAFHGHPVGLKESETDGLLDVFFCHQLVLKIDLNKPGN